MAFSEQFRFTTPDSAARVLQDYFAAKDREEVVAVLLDGGPSLIGLVRICFGGLRADSPIEPVTSITISAANLAHS